MSDVFCGEFLEQVAVYWQKLLVDGYGNPTYYEPVEIKCRWMDVVNELIDNKGTVIFSKTKILVDRDVTLGGMLMLSELESGMTAETAKDYEGAFEIKVFQKTPDVECRTFVRIAYL